MLDQATKELALATLADGPIPLPGPMSFDLAFNDGGAFGLRAPWWFFLIVTVIVLAVIVRALARTQRLTLVAAYGLVGAGALGNVVDRLTRPPGFPRGRVVDFIASTFWPTFNVADIGISIGCVLLLVAAFGEEDR